MLSGLFLSGTDHCTRAGLGNYGGTAFSRFVDAAGQVQPLVWPFEVGMRILPFLARYVRHRVGGVVIVRRILS